MTIETEINNRLNAMAAMQREIDVLRKLPDSLTVRTLFKLRDTYFLEVRDVSLQELCKLLPPLGLKLTADGYGRFTAEPSPQLATDTDRVHPIWTDNGCFGWFARLDDFCVLQVKLAREGQQDPWEPPYGLHAGQDRYFTRQPAALPLCEDQGPAAAFDAAWAQFFVDEGYNAGQKALAAAFKVVSGRNVELSASDLPVRPDTHMVLGASELTVLRAGAAPLETVPSGSPLFALPRIGSFWQKFDNAQALRLVAFSNRMRAPVAELEDKFIQSVLKKAKSYLEAFVEKHIPTQKTQPKSAVLAYVLKAHFGLDIHVGFRDAQRATGDRIRYEMWLGFRRWNEGASMTFPAVYDQQGFDWDFPDYEALANLATKGANA